eukprot:9469779-Pyramimonas_sp.AAC.1
MDSNLTNLDTTISERLNSLENLMNMTDVRVEKMEILCEELRAYQSSSGESLENKIRECID